MWILPPAPSRLDPTDWPTRSLASRMSSVTIHLCPCLIRSKRRLHRISTPHAHPRSPPNTDESPHNTCAQNEVMTDMSGIASDGVSVITAHVFNGMVNIAICSIPFGVCGWPETHAPLTPRRSENRQRRIGPLVSHPSLQ